MTSRVPISTRQDQENATSRLLMKQAIIKPSAPTRTGFANLENTVHNTQIARPKKKVDAAAVANKENIKTIVNKGKPKEKKIVRQESVLRIDAITTVETEIISEKTKGLVIYDPDEDSRNDPQLVTDYVQDIMAYFKEIESKFPLKETFLEGSKVTPKMRSLLVNWIVDVHYNFKMEPETLYLCVSIADRYMQLNNTVDRSTYQLVGSTALFLASKYEEVYPPELSDFVFVCDDAFSKKHMLRMEMDIVKKLDFRMGWPLSICFLRRYSKIACSTSEQHNLSKYILELALLEHNLAHIKPSIQAAAACCLSIAILTEVLDPSRCWTPTLMYYTKYKYADFKNVLVQLAHLIKQAKTSKHQASKEKYSRSKFNKVSLSNKLEGPLIRKLTLPPL